MTETMPATLIAPDKLTRRIIWVDNAKALLIVLVVLGHFAHLDPSVKTIIYAFHLPAFLFLTGFMLSSSVITMGAGDFCRKFIFPYSRLYLFFSAFSLLTWLAAKFTVLQTDLTPLDAVANALYGTQSDEQRFIHENGPLWYLPFLVVALIGFFIALRLPLMIRLAFILAWFAFSVTYSGPRLPWSSDAAGVGLLFIYSGYALRQYINANPARNIVPRQKGMLVLAFVASAIALVALALFNSKTNINILLFGDNVVLYAVTAFVGIYCVMAACLLIPHNLFLDELSFNSLIIFCVHIYAVKVANRLLLIENPVVNTLASAVAAIAIAAACIVASKIMMPGINKYILQRK